jgi:hypothetical protein
MKKTKLALSIAAALICTTATMEAYARTSIVEIKNQVAALENTMPTKADQAYVDKRLDRKAGKRYVDRKLNNKASKRYVDRKIAAIDLTSSSQGPIGAAGPQGLKGNAGSTGPQGLKGDTGATGADGINGISGTNGKDGATGQTGAMGGSCTAIQFNGSASIKCSDGTLASVYSASIIDGFTTGDTLVWKNGQ